MKKFKQLLFVVLLLGSVISVGAIDRQEMPFHKYDFVRTQYNPDDIGYLLGNAEMGGIADNTGLGFEKLWFTDVWENDRARKYLPGIRFSCKELRKRDLEKSTFQNRYRLKDGVYTTSVLFDDGFGFESRMFFSIQNKHQFVFTLANTASKKVKWEVRLPVQDYKVVATEQLIQGGTRNQDTYTKVAWAFHSSQKMKPSKEQFAFELEPGEEALFLFSVTSHFDGENYRQQAFDVVHSNQSYDQLEKSHAQAWDDHWKFVASIILPDGHYAKWFYRALRGIYNTTGAEHFLAAELQFAVPDPDWKMHSFTYGHGGGWPIWVFAQMGDHKRAMDMIKWTYKPEVNKKNVEILFPEGPVDLVYRGKNKGVHTYIEKYNPNAIAFGHEVTTEGYNITYSTDRHWDWQRHVDGYTAAFFHLMDRLYPDPQFTDNFTYPVLRGTAELWRSLVKWDADRKIYFLPPLLSVSENIMEKSVLDAVLSARWNLKMAAQYAANLGVDSDLKERWLEIYDKLYVPQNEDIFLEYLDDPQDRAGGGYFGIRAFACFGYPYLEEMKNIDPQKARRALDLAWERNNKGHGMISFISDWFALTEAYLGYGDKAYEISELTTHLLDPSETAMCEAFSYDQDGNLRRRISPYFFTGYDALVLVPMAMMLHSYDNVIKVFPSMPKAFQNAAFYDLVAEQGIRVSGEWRDGKLARAVYRKDGEVLLRMNQKKDVKINQQNGKLSLKVIQ